MDYDLLGRQVKELSEGAAWDVTIYANVAALLYENVKEINWAGFYLMKDGELLLGPFQGKVACMRIPVGKGVCGTSVMEDKIQRVEDVHQFPGHIACDCASESEIVLPLHLDGRIIGVLDIDSPVKGRFTPEDEKGLKMIAEAIEDSLKRLKQLPRVE